MLAQTIAGAYAIRFKAGTGARAAERMTASKRVAVISRQTRSTLSDLMVDSSTASLPPERRPGKYPLRILSPEKRFINSQYPYQHHDNRIPRDESRVMADDFAPEIRRSGLGTSRDL